jgi:hypothetical protein
MGTQKNTAETINALMFDKDEFNSPLESRDADFKDTPVINIKDEEDENQNSNGQDSRPGRSARLSVGTCCQRSS